MTPRFPRRGSPHSFGCVRATARDHCGQLAWERPDGSYVYVHHRIGTLVQLLPSLPPLADVEAVKR